MPLLRYNVRSVLRNINLAQIEEIIDVMDSIARCLDTTAGTEGKRVAEQALAVVNKGPILRIVQAIESNPDWPLLRMAVERLLEARNGNRLEILGAVSELEHLAEEKVLISPTVWPKEYAEALDDFLDLPPLSLSEGSHLSKNSGGSPARKKSSAKGRATRKVSTKSQQEKKTTKSSAGPSERSKESEDFEVVNPQDTVKRTPLPDLPDPKVIPSKNKPSTPRRNKRPAPMSDEYVVSSPTKPSPTTPKRGKTAKACDECRRRKTKCLKDEGEEKCKSCFKMSRECLLSSPTPPKAVTRGLNFDAALGEPVEIATKTEETVSEPKTEMKNILHDFGDLEEGRALGIVADADGEDPPKCVEEAPEVTTPYVTAPDTATPEVATPSDSDDHDYHPSKRVCRPGKKGTAKSVKKVSSIVVE